MTDNRTFLGCLTVSTTASVKVIFFFKMALYRKTLDKDQTKFQNSNCGINGVNYTFFFLTTTFVAEHYRLKHNPNDWSSAKVWTYSMTLFTTTDVRKLGSDLEQTPVKFPHSPILHYTFSSWTEKTMTKTIHCHWENRFVLQ